MVLSNEIWKMLITLRWRGGKATQLTACQTIPLQLARPYTCCFWYFSDSRTTCKVLKQQVKISIGFKIWTEIIKHLWIWTFWNRLAGLWNLLSATWANIFLSQSTVSAFSQQAFCGQCRVKQTKWEPGVAYISLSSEMQIKPSCNGVFWLVVLCHAP